MDGPWVLPGHPDYEQERVVRLSFPRELTPGEIYRNRLLDCGYSESRVMTSLEYDEMFEEEKRKKKAEAKAAKTKTKAAQAKARAAKAAKAKEAEAKDPEAKEAEAKDDGLHPAQQCSDDPTTGIPLGEAAKLSAEVSKQRPDVPKKPKRYRSHPQAQHKKED